MTYLPDDVATTTAQHANPLAAIIVFGSIGLGFVVFVVLFVRAIVRAHRALRFCPCCGARAVRDGACDSLNVIEVCASLQCGQCGTWRRLEVTHADQHAHAVRVERDRRRIRGEMLRLERRRRTSDFRAFLSLLQSEIAGAEDFLAQTRPPRPFAPRPRYPRGGER